MPDGNAQRPGDVVTSLSGQTIEVINTDAEGRLVLADAMTWAQRQYKPEVMVDLATLTGAMIIALGHEYGGMFSNDDGLAGKLDAAGKAVGDKLWRMPLGEPYDKLIEFADRRHEECRPARGRIDHRRRLPPALRREWRQMGASRHCRHGLVGQGRAPLRQGRDRLRRRPARPLRRRQFRDVIVDFYHLSASPLERVLPTICERVLASGERLLVVAEEGLLPALDELLWTYAKDSFLPHGIGRAAKQPILLSSEPVAANGATHIALADGRWREEALGFARTFYFFDNDRLDDARDRLAGAQERRRSRAALLEAGRAREMGAGALSLALRRAARP